MNHRIGQGSPALSATAMLAAALAMHSTAHAGPVSSRAQDPQLALAESSALAMAQRVQGQHVSTSHDAADPLNPIAVISQVTQEDKFKNGAASALKAGNQNPQAACQVNFVPLPTPAYNRGLHGASTSSSPTYVVAKGPVVVKC